MTHRHHSKVTPQEVVASLMGSVCPACAGKKKNRQTFCGGCYAKLTAPVQRNLYRRMGQGYEAALQAAWAELNPPQFHHPPADARRVS